MPNNASLVVAGDFDSAKVKPLIAKLFGTLPKSAEPAHKTAPPAKLGSVVRETTHDKVQLPKVCCAYHSPAIFAEGDAEMDLLGAVLSQGKSSRLYKRLVMDEKIATDVSAGQSKAKLQSVFRIDVTTPPGADLDKVEKMVDEEVGRLLGDGVKPAELEHRKVSLCRVMVDPAQHNVRFRRGPVQANGLVGRSFLVGLEALFRRMHESGHRPRT